MVSRAHLLIGENANFQCNGAVLLACPGLALLGPVQILPGGHSAYLAARLVLLTRKALELRRLYICFYLEAYQALGGNARGPMLMPGKVEGSVTSKTQDRLECHRRKLSLIRCRRANGPVSIDG